MGSEPNGPIRVLQLIESLGQGGEQRQMVTLVNAFDRRVVAPEVAVYHPLDHFRPELERSHTPIHVLGVRGGRDPRVAVRLARLLRDRRYDVVHTRLKTPGVLGRVATSIGPRPRVVLSEGGIDLGRVRWRLVLERLLAGRADAMIVNASAIQRHVEDLVPGLRGRVRLVPNGIDWVSPREDDLKAAADFRRRQLGDRANVLLASVARLEAPKDPHLVLDALGRLDPEALSRIRLVWIGSQNDPALLSSVEARARREGLSGRVAFLPPTRRIRPVYLGIDALVMSSKSEGLPNAVLEAMADGVPVVATNVGDVDALVEHGVSGWLVPPGGADVLAATIGRLVNATPDERRRVGEAGARVVREGYSARKLADRTLAVYREVLGIADGEPGECSTGGVT